ncbi:Sorbin and SH3 domain-containing protein 2 [Thoreauomyces humboldtii]|nr:Sorbin and SH3 domain-containing protein 2 [Thoreauomyces humboldtii]
MGGKEKPDKKRSLFKSLFGKTDSLTVDLPPSDRTLEKTSHSNGARPSSKQQQDVPPPADPPNSKRPSFQIHRKPDNGSVPFKSPGVPEAQAALPGRRTFAPSKAGSGQPPQKGGPDGGTDSSAKKDSPASTHRRATCFGTPVLVLEGSEGVTLELFLDEYRRNVPSFPSTLSGGTTAPVLRIESWATSLNGVLRVTNKQKPFVSARLAIMLFTGQGRTGIPVNDPEAPSAAGLHSRPIARSAAYIWKEPVLVESGQHEFPFIIPLSAGVPATLTTFSPAHANRVDVWHAAFVKMRRNEMDNIIGRQDLVLQKCLPESSNLKDTTRSKTATGSIAEEMIDFRAEGADMCDVDGASFKVVFQASRNNLNGNLVLMDAVECQWKERVTLREGRAGAVTRLERALHAPIRIALPPDATDLPLTFSTGFDTPIQPDGEFDGVKVTHEVVFTVEYFLTPLAEQMTRELVVVPVRFLASIQGPAASPTVTETPPSLPPSPPSSNMLIGGSISDYSASAAEAARRMSHQSQQSQGSFQSNPLMMPQIRLQADTVSRKGSQTSSVSHQTGKRFRAEHDFYPSEEDEVQLAIGDTVVIWQSFEDGWATGENLRTGAKGFFPLNALEENAWNVSEAAAAGLLAPIQSEGQFKTCARQASRVPTHRSSGSTSRESRPPLPSDAGTRRDPSVAGGQNLAVNTSALFQASSAPHSAPAATYPVEAAPISSSSGPASPASTHGFMPTVLQYGFDTATSLPTPRFEYNTPQYQAASPQSITDGASSLQSSAGQHSSGHSHPTPDPEPVLVPLDTSSSAARLPSANSPPLYQFAPSLSSSPLTTDTPDSSTSYINHGSASISQHLRSHSIPPQQHFQDQQQQQQILLQYQIQLQQQRELHQQQQYHIQQLLAMQQQQLPQIWDNRASLAPSHRVSTFAPPVGHGSFYGSSGLDAFASLNLGDPYQQQQQQAPLSAPSDLNSSRASHHSSVLLGSGVPGGLQQPPTLPLLPLPWQSIADFVPQEPGEVELRVGDAIIVEKTLESGWCLGENLRTMDRGYFPATSVAPTPQEQQPSQLPDAAPSYELVASPSLPTPQMASPTTTIATSSSPHTPVTAPVVTEERLSGIQTLLKQLDLDLVQGRVDPQEYLKRRDDLTARAARASPS